MSVHVQVQFCIIFSIETRLLRTGYLQEIIIVFYTIEDAIDHITHIYTGVLPALISISSTYRGRVNQMSKKKVNKRLQYKAVICNLEASQEKNFIVGLKIDGWMDTLVLRLKTGWTQ